MPRLIEDNADKKIPLSDKDERDILWIIHQLIKANKISVNGLLWVVDQFKHGGIQ